MTKSKNILGTVSAVAVGLLMCICSLVMFACGPKNYGENAIVISNYEELKTFLTDFSTKDYLDNEISDDGKFVVISNDIDCQGEVLTPLLSKDYYGLRFKIDGDGHTISNFKLDKTCVRSVGTAPGTDGGTFRVLSLFPRSEGGELSNIGFSNYTIEATFEEGEINTVDSPGQPWESTCGLKVGLVGYSKSNGALESPDLDVYPSKYSNVTISNATVNITMNGISCKTAEFPFSIGALIGLDADTTNYGENLQETSSMAKRENINVTKFEVNVIMNNGAVLIGGIAGQSNWERVTYTGCQVKESTFKVTTAGQEIGSFQGFSLGSAVAFGGIIGGSVKPQHEIVVKNFAVDIDYIVNGGTNETTFAGSAAGLIIESTSGNGDLHKVDIDNAKTSTSTVKVGEAEAKAVENNYIAK